MRKDGKSWSVVVDEEEKRQDQRNNNSNNRNKSRSTSLAEMMVLGLVVASTLLGLLAVATELVAVSIEVPAAKAPTTTRTASDALETCRRHDNNGYLKCFTAVQEYAVAPFLNPKPTTTATSVTIYQARLQAYLDQVLGNDNPNHAKNKIHIPATSGPHGVVRHGLQQQ